MWEKPTWEPLNLHCGPCGHEWAGWQPSGVAPRVWVAHIRSLHCPRCGANRKLFLLMREPIAIGNVDDGR